MINDTTLMEWELTPSPNGYLQQAVAEIRQLRDMLTMDVAPAQMSDGRGHLIPINSAGMRQVIDDLAAHQAVVRELARFLEEEHRLRNATHYCDHSCLVRILLAHPLVQQAREEKS